MGDKFISMDSIGLSSYSINEFGVIKKNKKFMIISIKGYAWYQ